MSDRSCTFLVRYLESWKVWVFRMQSIVDFKPTIDVVIQEQG